jgi:hypothetical protein
VDCAGAGSGAVIWPRSAPSGYHDGAWPGGGCAAALKLPPAALSHLDLFTARRQVDRMLTRKLAFDPVYPRIGHYRSQAKHEWRVDSFSAHRTLTSSYKKKALLT